MNGNGSQSGTKRPTLRIALAGGIVALGLGALVAALALTLNHYPVEAATATQAGSDRSSAVIAVLTPVVAGIIGVVGLYFGISATGSSRGQQAQASADATQSAADTAKVAVQTSADVAQSATDAAKSASEAAKSVADAAQSTA